MSLHEAHVQPAKQRRRSGKRMTFLIPADIAEALKELAQDHERSVAAEIRWILRKATDEPEWLS